jgi:membrane protease YdiL (CAAX protease family)
MSIIVSAFIFGIGHVINFLIFGNYWSSMTQIVTGIMIGVFFAYIVLRTSSLVPSIIIHYLYNSFVPLFIVYDKSDPQASFYLQILFGCLIPIVINLILSRFLPSRKQETV